MYFNKSGFITFLKKYARAQTANILNYGYSSNFSIYRPIGIWFPNLPFPVKSMTLEEMIPAGNIRFAEGFDDWHNAIQAACTPLLEHGSLAQQHVNAMIRKVERHGPVPLSPGVVVLRTDPQLNAYAAAMSLLKISRPVQFGIHMQHHVKLIFSIAITDSKSHQPALCQLARLIMNPEKLQKLHECNSASAVAALISSIPDDFSSEIRPPHLDIAR